MLQYQAGASALRKATLTVDQLARAVDAELMILRARGGTPGRRAHERVEAEVEYAVQRIRQVTHVSSVGRADSGSLVFVEDGEMLDAALECGAAAILLPPSLASRITRQKPSGPALLMVARPRLQFARAAQLLRPVEPARGVHSTALIAPGATVGLRTSIGPYVVIEVGATIGAGVTIGYGSMIGAGVTIGADCRIHPRVVIYPGTSLGDRVVVQAGAVLGSEGFGYVRDDATGVYVQFPQEGTLVIEDDVEIGANTTIDRGALDETRIASGVKIDNLVHVGHNVTVGANTVIAAQAGISGSSSIGAGAVLAGQVGIGDHAAVGDGVILGGQGGVLPHKNLRGPGQLFWGTPAKPVKQHLRELASLTRLARRKPAGDPSQEA